MYTHIYIYIYMEREREIRRLSSFPRGPQGEAEEGGGGQGRAGTGNII